MRSELSCAGPWTTEQCFNVNVNLTQPVKKHCAFDRSKPNTRKHDHTLAPCRGSAMESTGPGWTRRKSHSSAQERQTAGGGPLCECDTTASNPQPDFLYCHMTVYSPSNTQDYSGVCVWCAPVCVLVCTYVCVYSYV